MRYSRFRRRFRRRGFRTNRVYRRRAGIRL